MSSQSKTIGEEVAHELFELLLRKLGQVHEGGGYEGECLNCNCRDGAFCRQFRAYPWTFRQPAGEACLLKAFLGLESLNHTVKSGLMRRGDSQKLQADTGRPGPADCGIID